MAESRSERTKPIRAHVDQIQAKEEASGGKAEPKPEKLWVVKSRLRMERKAYQEAQEAQAKKETLAKKKKSPKKKPKSKAVWLAEHRAEISKKLYEAKLN